MTTQGFAGWHSCITHVDGARPRTLAASAGTVLGLLALSGCGQPPGPPSTTTSSPAVAAAENASGVPKVPFNRQPCKSLSIEELGQLGIRDSDTNKPSSGKPMHDGRDDFAYDNACDYGSQTLAYKTIQDCTDQRDELRNAGRAAPADVPGAFYDVLGNLWFVKNGYCVAIPNNVSATIREQMARVIAAKL